MGTADSVQHNRIRIVFAHDYESLDDEFNTDAIAQQQSSEGTGKDTGGAEPEEVDRNKYFVSNSVNEGEAGRPMAEVFPEGARDSGGFVINTWGFLAATEKGKPLSGKLY